MIKIYEAIPEYNENILTADFTFDNSLAWEFTVGTGLIGNTVATSTEKHYVGTKSLKIINEHYDTNAIQVSPTTSGDYEFTIPKTGIYRFSMRVIVTHDEDDFPETDMTGRINFYKNANPTPFHFSEYNIKNIPEEGDVYYKNRWQTFYDEVSFTASDVISISIYIEPDTEFLPGSLQVYFDGFKVEYINDRIEDLPTLYSLPIN